MREILFRGKSKDGEWGYGFYVKATKHYQNPKGVHEDWIVGSAVQQGGRVNLLRKYAVIPETVGQYTGLKDKNGKKIFEGDVFKFEDEVWESCETSCGTEYNSWPVENFAVVGFDEDTGCPDFVKYKYSENTVEADLHENHDIDFSDFLSELEVIGNIHDNPELITGEEE